MPQYLPTTAKAVRAEEKLRHDIRELLLRKRRDNYWTVAQLADWLEIPQSQAHQLVGTDGAPPTRTITLRTLMRILDKLRLKVELVKE